MHLKYRKFSLRFQAEGENTLLTAWTYYV